MKRIFSLFAAAMLFACVVGGTHTLAQAAPLTAEHALRDPTHRAEIEAFWAKVQHSPDARKYFIAKDGTIYAVLAPRTGRLFNVVNAWHCYAYRPVGEWNIHTIIGARVVGEIADDDFAQVAARYDTQCMEEKAGEWLVKTTRTVATLTVMLLAW